MRKLAEIRSEIAAKSRELQAIFTEAGPELDFTKAAALKGIAAADTAAEIKRRNAELAALETERGQVEAVEVAAKNAERLNAEYNTPASKVRFPAASGGNDPHAGAVRDLKSILQESAGLAEFKSRGYRGNYVVVSLTPDERKTLMTLSTLAPVTPRQPGIREFPQEQRTVRDLLLPGTMQTPSISYLVETTFTNNAAEVAEGGTKPESALAFTETVESAQVIATWIPATRQILDDLDYMQTYIEGRLTLMVKRREEVELLNGDGVSPDLKGLLNRTGVQTQARGTDNNPDAILKAIVKVRNTAFADPTAVVINPTNYQNIRLLKDANGNYIFGTPSDNANPTLWGMEVRETTAIASGTALVISRADAQVLERMGMQILVSTEHSTYFVENKLAILAEERLALAVYRPASFCSVTGLN